MKKMALMIIMATLAVAVAAAGGRTEDGATETGHFPAQSIRILVPYSAGGGGDTVARIVADSLGRKLGVQVNVINLEGAGGEIGITEMARSNADGYTLGVFGYPDNFVLENTRETEFQFDSFEYLASFDDMPMGIFAGPGSSFRTIDQLIAYGKKNPGRLTIGESGALGLLHALAFSDLLGIETTPVTLSGGADLMNTLLGNHIELASTSSMSHNAIVDAGGHPIGFAAADRMEMFPGVPTFKEQGINLEMGVSRVLVAPKGTPENVLTVITEALDIIGADPDFRERFEIATLPYRYMNRQEVNDALQRSNNVLMPVIERNRKRF
ncbi:Tripartite-type tricarboxylate transporter, receptor component TctC [Alkalispirochaeta americana]|uniref:Tripartite-type tricarboxylate transporter, receptor component TctC n=1 Tax=Alkalispirochaeta americana TaxID=159291 RepID=A0A1N6UV64_9SPIO|nr:tripartite tricarboxylate transporter substrate binding protein [Alkalispirochaeta americana]SIQ69555.1 Tripartite-type tricarboxylate transporter, receptor component TctC [Alkalispirochaeta americana]